MGCANAALQLQRNTGSIFPAPPWCRKGWQRVFPSLCTTNRCGQYSGHIRHFGPSFRCAAASGRLPNRGSGVLIGRLAGNDAETSDPETSRTHECCQAGSLPACFLRALRYAFVTLPQNIAVELFLGILIAAA